MTTSRTFTVFGQPLALDPRAFGLVMLEPPQAREARMIDGGVAIVDVRGPLMHHADLFCDSYDAIKDRVVKAHADGATKILLAIDSPGGLVSGAFETAREIRAFCDERSIELIAYVDGCATSAAYAIACVAKRVYAPPTALIGSIGIVDAIVDITAQDAAQGVAFSMVASGARKLDGQPHAPTTDAAVAAVRTRVDALASIFFAHVAEYRPVSAEQVAAMEAGVFVAGRAQALGLIDEVATFDHVLALVRSGAINAAAAATSEVPMSEEEKARAALQAIVDSEDASEKAKARASAALAAMDEEEKTEEEPKPAAEEDEEEKPMMQDDEKPSASAAIGALARLGSTANTLEARLANVEKLLESEKRASLRASRPDVAASVHDALAALPLAQYAAALSKIEKPKRPNPAAAITPSATRGESQSDRGASRLDPKAKAELDRMMGLAPTAFGVVSSEFKQVFGAPKPVKES